MNILLSALIILAVDANELYKLLQPNNNHQDHSGGSEAIWINPSANEKWGIPYNDRVIYTNPDLATQIVIGVEQNMREQARQNEARKELNNILLHDAITKGKTRW